MITHASGFGSVRKPLSSLKRDPPPLLLPRPPAPTAPCPTPNPRANPYQWAWGGGVRQLVHMVLVHWRDFGVTPSRFRIDNPQVGQVYLISKEVVKGYRRDGHEWKRRPNSHNTREDHVQLRLEQQVVIYACYAFSATVENLTRRIFWLIANSDIALVHYVVTETRERTLTSPRGNPAQRQLEARMELDVPPRAPPRPPAAASDRNDTAASSVLTTTAPAAAATVAHGQPLRQQVKLEPEAASDAGPSLQLLEYLPDTADTAEATKVLLVGAWALGETGSTTFEVYFGRHAPPVPATLTSSASLRCMTPVHLPPGSVDLFVRASDGRVSNAVPFTFVHTDDAASAAAAAAAPEPLWASMDVHQFQADLPQLLASLEAEVQAEMRTLAEEASATDAMVVDAHQAMIAPTEDDGASSALEKDCMDVVVRIATLMGKEAFASRFWTTEDGRGLTLAHYTCALGYADARLRQLRGLCD